MEKKKIKFKKLIEEMTSKNEMQDQDLEILKKKVSAEVKDLNVLNK